jgi:hypothetical protein
MKDSRKMDILMYYTGCYIFLFNWLAPAQRSAIAASSAACRGGWNFDDGRETNDRSDKVYTV